MGGLPLTAPSEYNLQKQKNIIQQIKEQHGELFYEQSKKILDVFQKKDGDGELNKKKFPLINPLHADFTDHGHKIDLSQSTKNLRETKMNSTAKSEKIFGYNTFYSRGKMSLAGDTMASTYCGNFGGFTKKA